MNYQKGSVSFWFRSDHLRINYWFFAIHSGGLWRLIIMTCGKRRTRLFSFQSAAGKIRLWERDDFVCKAESEFVLSSMVKLIKTTTMTTKTPFWQKHFYFIMINYLLFYWSDEKTFTHNPDNVIRSHFSLVNAGMVECLLIITTVIRNPRFLCRNKIGCWSCFGTLHRDGQRKSVLA